MDSAQDKITGEIVEAEQLWLIAEVDKDRYQFFVAEQGADDMTLFRVTDHRLICCLVDEIIYPPLSK